MKQQKNFIYVRMNSDVNMYQWSCYDNLHEDQNPEKVSEKKYP